MEYLNINFDMITLFLILIASFLCALSERLNGYFYKSIFRHLNPHFWNRRQSYNYCKMFYSYPLDAWFYIQVLKVVFICAAIVLYSPITIPIVDFFLYAGAWCFNYDVFYTGILKDK